MPRYVTTIETPFSIEENTEFITDFLTAEGFKEATIAGERVYKKGVGLLLAPQFFTFNLNEGSVDLQAWTKFVMLPGLYVGEMGITGALGAIPKKQLRNRVIKIASKISNTDWKV